MSRCGPTDLPGKRPSLLPVVVVIGLIALLLAATKPSRADFIAWMKQEATRQTDNALAKGMVALFGGWFVDSGTTEIDRVLFKLFIVPTQNDEELIVLGIAGQFIPLSSGKRADETHQQSQNPHWPPPDGNDRAHSALDQYASAILYFDRSRSPEQATEAARSIIGSANSEGLDARLLMAVLQSDGNINHHNREDPEALVAGTAAALRTCFPDRDAGKDTPIDALEMRRALARYLANHSPLEQHPDQYIDQVVRLYRQMCGEEGEYAARANRHRE